MPTPPSVWPIQKMKPTTEFSSWLSDGEGRGLGVLFFCLFQVNPFSVSLTRLLRRAINVYLAGIFVSGSFWCLPQTAVAYFCSEFRRLSFPFLWHAVCSQFQVKLESLFPDLCVPSLGTPFNFVGFLSIHERSVDGQHLRRKSIFLCHRLNHRWQVVSSPYGSLSPVTSSISPPDSFPVPKNFGTSKR